MFVSDLGGNVKLTAGCNPSSFRAIKISYYIFFSSKIQNNLKAWTWLHYAFMLLYCNSLILRKIERHVVLKTEHINAIIDSLR